MASSFRLCLLFFFISTALAELPGGLKGCKQSSKDFSKCLSQQVNHALKFFKDGNKKMGVNPIEPFKFQRLLIDQGTGPVAIKLEFKNLNLHGVSNTKILDTKCDWKEISFKANLDNLLIFGEYKINGKVLVLPIAGNGASNITMTNLDVTAKMKLKEFQKGGKSYFKGETFEIIISPKRTFFQLENLFNGDKALGDNMNLFLNENHAQIVNELKPAVSKALSQAFLQVANQVFSKIPANEIKLA
ncbi:protein takeout [Halyomorpha halys]|uniref:protein takeout n=1 Tax=Halyomorpha halys TaxID=286706 RepID=UPI0006D51160|nr:protein takeout-like [Halyomorpha halys]